MSWHEVSLHCTIILLRLTYVDLMGLVNTNIHLLKMKLKLLSASKKCKQKYIDITID